MDKSKYIQAYHLIKRFYEGQLKSNPAILADLSKRCTSDSIKKFGLGYCPDQDQLYIHLSRIFDRDFILSLGIFSDTPNGVIDRFSNRIMFPIGMLSEPALGFVGRTSISDPAKYLNSSDTVFFKKSSFLFGFRQAVQTILQKNFVFLVEGLFDVIAMHEAGFTNTVGVLGTTLTDSQLSFIGNFTDNIVIFFDGDSAGQNASMSLLSKHPDMSAIHLPADADPDSLYHEIGIDAFRDFVCRNLSINDILK